jgi:hypothetical protein
VGCKNHLMLPTACAYRASWVLYVVPRQCRWRAISRQLHSAAGSVACRLTLMRPAVVKKWIADRNFCTGDFLNQIDHIIAQQHMGSDAEIFTRRDAQSLLREGARRGLVSMQERDGWPQNVWAVVPSLRVRRGTFIEATFATRQQAYVRRSCLNEKTTPPVHVLSPLHRRQYGREQCIMLRAWGPGAPGRCRVSL